MSDHEKIDNHKNLDGDDGVGNGVCNAKGPRINIHSGQIGSEDSTAVQYQLWIVKIQAWSMENCAKKYHNSLE